MSVTTERVRYRDGSIGFTGVLARPDAADGAARVVVVHGGAGLDHHAEEQAARYAELGYVTFACDMYGDGVAGDRDRVLAAINALRGDRAAMHTRVDAAVAALDTVAPRSGRYAVIGYCFGGMVALEFARSGGDAAAVVSIHGSLATSEPAARGGVSARLLVCHGALDPHVPLPDVTSFITEMNEADADWQLNVYGGAMHGFTHRAATTASNGVAYNEIADLRSFEATKRLLREVLIGASASAES